MRIALYLPVLERQPAGLGVYIREVCSRLTKLHPDSVVFTQDPDAVPEWLRGARVEPCGPKPRLGRLAVGARRRLYRTGWLFSKAWLDLRRVRADVFFSPVHEAQLISPVPQAVVVHDLTPLRFPEAYSPLHVAQTRYLLPRVLRRVDRIVAVSQNTKRDLIELFGIRDDRIDVVYEGFDPTVFRPRSSDEIVRARAAHGLPERYLLYAGTFSRHKNLPAIVRAFSTARSRAPDVVFAIAGRTDSGAYEEFVSEVKRCGAEAAVKVLGYVSSEDLGALMSGAAAFVYPSRYEGFGLAPLEALACGAPVLASNVASLPEVVGSGGVLVDGNDASAWEAGLVRLLEQSARGDQREELRRRALAQAARFSWDDAAEQLLSRLRHLAAR